MQAIGWRLEVLVLRGTDGKDGGDDDNDEKDGGDGDDDDKYGDDDDQDSGGGRVGEFVGEW